MPIDARRMLAFSDAMNAKWWPFVEKASADVLCAPVDFSFLTPLGILTHMANIEQAWVDVAEGQEAQWARHSTKKWNEAGPVLAYAREARERTHRVVDALTDAQLQAPHATKPGIFAKDSFTTEEILFTIFTHEQWHRGELLAALWSKNVEPPPVDWPRFATPLTL